MYSASITKFTIDHSTYFTNNPNGFFVDITTDEGYLAHIYQ